jgi:hypothetical protein
VFSFQRQKKKGISVQVWGCAMSHASPDSSLTPGPSQLFPCNYTLVTMCNLSLGVWEHNFTHLVSLKKKKKNCMFMLSLILVDLKFVIDFISELKILNT